MNKKFSSLIINALGFEAYLSKLGSTIKIPSSQSPEACLWLPLVFVFALLMDFFVHEDALTPIVVLKLVLESCSGLPHFPFRIYPAIGENWSSTKRFMGAISPTYFDIIQEKKKKKKPLQAFRSTSLTAKPGWGGTLESSPSVASWKCLYRIWAFCRVPFPSEVLCFLCIFSLYTLTPFQFSLKSYLSLDEQFFHWLDHLQQFHKCLFLISVGRNWWTCSFLRSELPLNSFLSLIYSFLYSGEES